jgi:hypothetical protein
MATKIITKTGSGAPTTSDVDRGELAVDLTNKQLYTNDGTDIIKLGSGSGEGQWSLASNGDDIYYDQGNVGIGTDNPDKSLHILNSSARDTTTPLLMQNAGPTGTTVELRLVPTAYPNDIGSTARWSAIRAINGGAGNPTELAFLTNSTSADPEERMRIDDNGNVGIGTSGVPAAKLDISTGSNEDSGPIAIRLGVSSTNTRSAEIVKDTTTRDLEFHAAVGNSGSNTVFYSSDTNETMRIASDGRVGIGGTPSRSTKEIEDDAVSTLASLTQISEMLKAEPKADKKAVTLEITGHDKLPTKAELIRRLTERNIGGGSAKLQVLGDGYFSGTVNAGVTAIKDNRIYDTARNTGIIFDATRCVIPCDGAGASATGEISIGRVEWKFKDAYFSGTVNAGELRSPIWNSGVNTQGGLRLNSAGGLGPTDHLGNNTDGAMDLGRNTSRFKDAYFSGDVSCSTINGALPFNTRNIIETLSTLRAATQDETTLEGLRDSIGNAIGGLIEKFEAMADAVEPARER